MLITILTLITRGVIINALRYIDSCELNIDDRRTTMILDPALSVARRGALAYVGAIALTSDFVSTTIEKFAKRGTTAQQAALEQFKATIRRLRPESAPKPEGEQVAKAEQMLAQRRDQLLSALNIPTQSTLHSLNAQVDHLSAAIDELRTQARRAKTEPPV